MRPPGCGSRVYLRGSHSCRMWRMTRLLVGLFLCYSSVYAQTNAGQITGSVMDAQQAAIAGVKITATNIATNVSQIAVSSNAGVYSLPALEPGTYRIVAELSGFNRLIREPIAVETGKVQ